MIAMLSGLLATSNSEAGKFDLNQIVQTVKNSQRPRLQHTGPGHISRPGDGNRVDILPYPPIGAPPVCKPKLPIRPIYPPPNGGPPIIKPPVCKPKPPIYCPPVKPPVCIPKPPICPPVKPPVCIKPPICPPVKPPVCNKPPVKPPVCIKPQCKCNVCKCQVCQCGDQHVSLPINRPPVRVSQMTLMNNAGAEVHFSFKGTEQVESMPAEDVSVYETRQRQEIQIAYHNGLEVVQYDLDPSASYSFEWQGETLQLLQVEAPGNRLAQR